MANNLLHGQSVPVCGLGTWVFTCNTTNLHTVSIKTTDIPPSGLSISITQAGSGSDSFSFSSPSATQNHIELQGRFDCTAGDTLTIVLSSSSAIDKGYNNIKSIINCRGGLV